MSRNQLTRISEKSILYIFIIGGYVGGLLGMILFKHKINKFSFKWKAILIIIINLLFLLF